MQELARPRTTRETTATESTTQEEVSFDVAVDIIDDRIMVDWEQVTVTATDTQEGSERIITLEEETDTASFTLPSFEEQAAAIDISAWDILSDILDIPAVEPVQAVQPPAVPTTDQEVASTGAVPSMLEAASVQSSSSLMRHASDALDYTVLRFADWHNDIGHDTGVREEFGGIYRPPTTTTQSVDIRGSSLVPPAVQDEREPPGVTITDDTVRYTVDHAMVGDDTTVMDTILSLVETGTVEATLVEQPYYSPESFDIDGENRSAGWQTGYWFVQLEEFDVQMTEFSYGQDTPELAMDGIDEITVAAGDQIVFEESEMYSCGGYEVSEEMRRAWEDEYRWFDDDTERAVYAALAEGNEFLGAPIDLHDTGLDAVRDAYIEDFGAAPEAVFESVLYRG